MPSSSAAAHSSTLHADPVCLVFFLVPEGQYDPYTPVSTPATNRFHSNYIDSHIFVAPLLKVIDPPPYKSTRTALTLNYSEHLHRYKTGIFLQMYSNCCSKIRFINKNMQLIDWLSFLFWIMSTTVPFVLLLYSYQRHECHGREQLAIVCWKKINQNYYVVSFIFVTLCGVGVLLFSIWRTGTKGVMD